MVNKLKTAEFEFIPSAENVQLWELTRLHEQLSVYCEQAASAVGCSAFVPGPKYQLERQLSQIREAACVASLRKGIKEMVDFLRAAHCSDKDPFIRDLWQVNFVVSVRLVVRALLLSSLSSQFGLYQSFDRNARTYRRSRSQTVDEEFTCAQAVLLAIPSLPAELRTQTAEAEWRMLVFCFRAARAEGGDFFLPVMGGNLAFGTVLSRLPECQWIVTERKNGSGKLLGFDVELPNALIQMVTDPNLNVD